MEAARVWMYCLARHRAARSERTPWPDRDELQRATKGGQYALHSQSIQMVCHQFLANVETSKQLRQTNPRHRYPYHPKQYLTVQWPAQAISCQGKRLILPMGRGRKSFSFHLPDLPERIGAVSLVWKGGYELHLVVPTAPEAHVPVPAPAATQASVDLGEIHQAAVTTSTGKGLIVTGRGMRSLKRQYNMTLWRSRACSRAASKAPKAGCACSTQKRAKAARASAGYATCGTRERQVVDFCRAEGVRTLYVGDPHGVRNQSKGRHHNQRMAQWEYGKDKQYLQEKCYQVGTVCFSGGERGTSSHCPRCDWKKKPTGRTWTCRSCGFVGHRDIVGSMNMHPLAFGSRISYPAPLTYRRPGPLRDRRQDKELSPSGSS